MTVKLPEKAELGDIHEDGTNMWIYTDLGRWELLNQDEIDEMKKLGLL